MFLEKDCGYTYTYIKGTHTEDLGISYYVDSRIIKINNEYYLSMSRHLDGP